MLKKYFIIIGLLFLAVNNSHAQDSLGTYRPADTSKFAMVRDLIVHENSEIKQNPKNIVAYVKRGGYYRHLCKNQLSIDDFYKAIELETDSHLISALYYWIGGAKDRLSNFNGAIEDFTTSIYFGENNIKCTKFIGMREMDMDIDLSRLYYDRGLVKNRIKQYQSAISDFEKAMEYHPDWSEAYFGIGLSYDRQEKYDSAIYNYKKAIKEDMYLVSAYNNLATIYTNQKKYSQAMPLYEKAIMLEPNYEYAYVGLMDLKLEMGDKQGACTIAQKYINKFGGYYSESENKDFVKKYCEGKN